MASCAWIDTHGHVLQFGKTRFREQTDVHAVALRTCGHISIINNSLKDNPRLVLQRCDTIC